MSERRSSRARKPLKYSAFGEDSDDDFADTTPPPPKKTKATSKKDGGKEPSFSICKTVADVSMSDSGKKRRAPLAEKIYERELQQALEMSLVQSQESNDKSVQQGNAGSDENDPAAAMPTLKHAGDDSKIEMAVEEERTPAAKMPVLKHVQGVVADDKIEVLGEGGNQPQLTGRTRRTSGNQANQRTAAKVKGKSQPESDEESDFESEDESEEDIQDDDDEDDDDSDFGYDSRPAAKKKTPAVKKQPVASRVKKQETGTKGVAAKGAPSSAPQIPKPSVPTRTPTVSSSSSSVPRGSAVKKGTATPPRPTVTKSVPPTLAASWKPPAFAGSPANTSSISALKSPSSGLRLGLSRNQRLKPLHPSLNVT